MAKKTLYDTPEQMREGLRRYLVRATDCAIQESVDGKGWPCGTCFMNLLTELGLDSSKPEYAENNGLRDGKTDRFNEVWRAILQIRDAGGKND